MKVLLADDERTLTITLSDELKGVGHKVTVIDNGTRAMEALKKEDFDCVLLDIKLPGLNGMQVLKRIKEIKPDLPVVIITGYGTVETAVEAIKAGAYDYILKPFLNQVIVLILEKIEKYLTLKTDYRRLKEQLQEKAQFANLVGKSKKMLEVYQLIESVAQTDCSVLIEGTSGTGKELVAEAIHYSSPRKDSPLIKMSCAVFPENLIESELFGYEKGAFTDAKREKIGRFEMADKGTVFIDDIDDMSLQTQVKLLRVLQEHEFERLGGTNTIKVDIRVLAATKRNLLHHIKEGAFREDLFYRLNVVAIRVPALKERDGDIPLLLKHFINKYGKGREYDIDPDTLMAMESYHWPGNVRELENAVERAVALAGTDNTLKKEHLLKTPLSQSPESLARQELMTLQEFLINSEIEYIKKIAKLANNNKGEVAKVLNISRKSLWEKLKKYNLEV